jgi:homogentisate 1,2-dioxygenase
MEKLIGGYENLEYNVGFGNSFASEAEKDALPKNQNTPKICPYNLYAEQLSGTAFTLPRYKNKRSWLYRIQPSVTQGVFKPCSDEFNHVLTDLNKEKNVVITPSQLRWRPLSKNSAKDFLGGLTTIAGAGSPEMKNGLAIYAYSFGTSMKNSAFYNSDGDFLIVPQKGNLYLLTEFGKMVVGQGEMVVIPRGIKFSVEVEEDVTGWICEVFAGHFELPDLGPIGANGLANPRDFLAPKAFYERKKEKFSIYNKFLGKFFVSESDHSPFDVVAWHGNYYPFKYDMRNFNVVNSVTYDHMDPSIFTVLTCVSDEPGKAICDFVVFKQRWMVAENTFRPPYYHRNTMSEFMGNIYGEYDAKGKGFEPGCSSLHLPMTPHGPDKTSYQKGISEEEVPIKFKDTMSFMFESFLMFKICKTAYDDAIKLDHDYHQCWEGLTDNFTLE